MPEPTVELYDDKQFHASQQASARRLAAARARGRRMRRWKALGYGILITGIPVLVAAGVAASHAPESPYLVVFWPKPKIPQTLAPNQTVLARGGQPFDVAVTDVSRWNVNWKSGGAEQQGGQFSWAPAEGAGVLTADCRGTAQGWERYFTRLWPTRRVQIAAVSPNLVNNYVRQIQTPREGVWVFPRIFAAGHVSWDERALPLLANAADLLPASVALANTKTEPQAGSWRLVSNFEGEAEAPSGNATFASLIAPDIETALPQIAARIARSAPQASVKFVLRLDRDPQQGILRVAFDGKGERAAWVRRAGDAQGQRFTGWQEGASKPKSNE